MSIRGSSLAGQFAVPQIDVVAAKKRVVAAPERALGAVVRFHPIAGIAIMIFAIRHFHVLRQLIIRHSEKLQERPDGDVIDHCDIGAETFPMLMSLRCFRLVLLHVLLHLLEQYFCRIGLLFCDIFLFSGIRLCVEEKLAAIGYTINELIPSITCRSQLLENIPFGKDVFVDRFRSVKNKGLETLALRTRQKRQLSDIQDGGADIQLIRQNIDTLVSRDRGTLQDKRNPDIGIIERTMIEGEAFPLLQKATVL